MDPTRFDTLVRSLTTGSSRRRLLGVLSALPLVGTALAGDEDASAGKGNGRGKRRGKRQDTSPEARSCTQRCHKKNTKQARRRCRKRCQTPPECTTNTDCPLGELCEDGRCLPSPDQCTTDTDCDVCEQCQGGVCVAQCQPDEVCRDNQCETVQCSTDRDCGDCARCVEGRCRWQCGVTEVCLSGAGGRCCQPRGCPAGQDCGTADDGCGRQLNCGACPTCQTCSGGACVADASQDGACCGSGQRCAAGVCTTVQTATLAECNGQCDCDSSCSGSPVLASTEVCGAQVSCPACIGGCTANGCYTNFRATGPNGVGYYCFFDTTNESCAGSGTCPTPGNYCGGANCFPLCTGA